MLKSSAVLVIIGAMTGAALAQPADLPRSYFRQPRIPPENSLTFCANPGSMLFEFETALAEELAGVLLLTPEIVEVEPLTPTPPYDFRLPLTEAEIYWFLFHRCDAFLGLTPAAEYPDWLTASPVYLETETVMAVTSPDYRRMSDIPPDVLIGVRLLSLAAGRLGSYLRVLPEAGRWSALLYPNHESVMDRLLDGSVGAVLIWEPALVRYMADHPDAPSVHVIRDLPFTVAPTSFVMALRPENSFLNRELALAVAALLEDGTMERLALEHDLSIAAR